MAILTLPASNRCISDRTAVGQTLADLGIIYESWGVDRLPQDLGSRHLDESGKQRVLDAFATDIERRSRLCGYRTADVVTLYPDTPDLDGLLAKFDRRHTHADDEVRFIVQGRGVFDLFPPAGEMVLAELHPGDFITIPADFPHRFRLCEERQITAIRLFTSPDGWIARYL